MHTSPPLSVLCTASKGAGAFLKRGIVLMLVIAASVASAGNLAGRYATITLDGSLADWQTSDTMYAEWEIGTGAPPNSVFTNVMVANDSNYVYVALQLSAPASILSNWISNIFIDTDVNPATGFNGGWMVAGYNRLVQYGGAGTTYSVYGFTGASQSDWTWNWMDLISYSYSDLVIEWAIPISSLGLTTNQMRMEFNASGDGILAETWAHHWESGVGTYTLATPPPAAPPTITSVSGAQDKVLVTFSKPVTAATAGSTMNYTFNGGLRVISATPDLINPRNVTLTTSPQLRGTLYTLNINGVKDEAGNAIAINSQMTFVSSIIIDGSFDDWSGLPTLFENGQGDPTATNFKELRAFNDANYIYLQLTLWEPSDLLSPQNNIFIDTDNNPATGNAFWGGAELLVEGGNGYQEKNGSFNEGLINGLNFSSSSIGGTNYEFRISRSATYVSDGLPVFTTNTINLAFDGESGWVTVNRMPPGLGTTIPYTLLEPLLPPPGPLAIALSGGGQVKLTWPGSATLQACGSVDGASWTNVPAATSPYTTPTSTQRLFFRLMQ